MILEVMRAALSDARARASWEEYALILAGIGRLQQFYSLCEMPTAQVPIVSRAQGYFEV